MNMTGSREASHYFLLGTIQTPDSSRMEITRYPHSEFMDQTVGIGADHLICGGAMFFFHVQSFLF